MTNNKNKNLNNVINLEEYKKKKLEEAKEINLNSIPYSATNLSESVKIILRNLKKMLREQRKFYNEPED